MQSLENLIKLAKDNDENAMLEIIKKFQPVINKYFKKSCYNEDVRSALELKLIEVVKADLNLDNFLEFNDGIFVNYIVSSLSHEYIKISIKDSKKSHIEMLCEEGLLTSLFDTNVFVYEQKAENTFLFDLLRKILTKREFDCVYNIVFMGYSPEELAEEWDISRQACNQCKKRAFDKIQKYLNIHNK